MNQTAKHVIFRGRVQGVGFRYTASHIAGRYEVTGFVRNLPDGSVEMLVQGSAQQVDHCIQDVREYFDDSIRDLQVKQAPFDPRYADFRIAF